MHKPSPAPFLDIPALLELARQHAGPGCQACAELCAGSGWESLASAYPRARLQQIGHLRRDSEQEPTLREHHPRGTHNWSAEAPIAPAFHPYNRCEVWACRACRRPYLRYTEYGGYYQDERIRVLAAELIDATGMAQV